MEPPSMAWLARSMEHAATTRMALSENDAQSSIGSKGGRGESLNSSHIGLFLRSWQWFYRRTPEFRGKGRVLRGWPSQLVRCWPSNVRITSREGCLFSHCDLKDYLYQVLFFCGYHELDVDWMCARLLRPGDMFVDIGACYGYHAVTNARRVGTKGRVFAFEPQPDAFAALRENALLNGLANIELENFAVSGRAERLQLHRFSDLGMGHTSIAALQRHTVSQEITCDAITLDDYIARKGIGRVTLVKLDVEGAELKVLMGAKGLLRAPKPPMWILEANETTACACGYRPGDLLSLLGEFGYRAYRAVWGNVPRRVLRIEPCPEEIGSNQNLLCLIPSVHTSALPSINGEGN